MSKYQCGFRTGYNAQHYLISLIEEWKNSVDNGGTFGAFLTDLSKACDFPPHELLIANLDAYGFDKISLKLIHSYLWNRKQRVKINDRYSWWSEILFGVPQGSILGPLSFNTFMCNMFYFLEEFDIVNYADDSTPYCAGKSAKFVVNTLDQSSIILFNCLNNNCMKVNTGKGNLLLKWRTIMKSFVTSQFTYCSLIFIFHSRHLNKKINSVHERALRNTYPDNTSRFQDLLNKDNSVSIHRRKLQVLATEMFKIHRSLSPKILRETFVSKTSSYNLPRNEKRKGHFVNHGTETLSFLDPKIWI